MRVRTYSMEGVVIRQSDLGEADRIVTILTQDLGKVRLVARGTRQPKSRTGGHLEPLNQVSSSSAHGRSLDVVSEAQTRRTFSVLSRDPEHLSQAVYMCDRDFSKASLLRASAQLRSEVERVLTEHIRYVLERRLKSVDFVRRVSEL